MAGNKPGLGFAGGQEFARKGLRIPLRGARLRRHRARKRKLRRTCQLTGNFEDFSRVSELMISDREIGMRLEPIALR